MVPLCLKPERLAQPELCRRRLHLRRGDFGPDFPECLACLRFFCLRDFGRFPLRRQRCCSLPQTDEVPCGTPRRLVCSLRPRFCHLPAICDMPLFELGRVDPHFSHWTWPHRVAFRRASAASGGSTVCLYTLFARRPICRAERATQAMSSARNAVQGRRIPPKPPRSSQSRPCRGLSRRGSSGRATAIRPPLLLWPDCRTGTSDGKQRVRGFRRRTCRFRIGWLS